VNKVLDTALTCVNRVQGRGHDSTHTHTRTIARCMPRTGWRVSAGIMDPDGSGEDGIGAAAAVAAALAGAAAGATGAAAAGAMAADGLAATTAAASPADAVDTGWAGLASVACTTHRR
jgi:hypothetical protein